MFIKRYMNEVNKSFDSVQKVP